MSLDRRDDIARIRFTDYDDVDIAREYEVVEHDVRGDFSLLFEGKGVRWPPGSRPCTPSRTLARCPTCVPNVHDEPAGACGRRARAGISGRSFGHGACLTGTFDPIRQDLANAALAASGNIPEQFAVVT